MSTTGLFHDVPTGDNIPKNINIIVEISEGSKIKYELDKNHNAIFVDRFLHTPIPYPFSYGLIPQTWNNYDHDPLDAIVVASESLIAGCVVPCRVIGMLSVDDDGERDDKIICVPKGDPYMKDIIKFEDLPHKKREDIEYFLNRYKDLEGKTVTVKSWADAEIAQKFILECVDCYKNKFKNN